MYTQDLEHKVYDTPEFLEAVKKLVLARSYAKVRVLVANPGRAVYDNSRFIGLARRITSYIDVRQVHDDYRSNHCAFLIADDRALVYRLQASRWDGIAEMQDLTVVRRYLNFFDKMWKASEPHAETRALHLLTGRSPAGPPV